MTTSILLGDPAHWHQRAREMRRLAQDMADPDIKRTMLNIAADYETLAKRAEERKATEQTES
jgi:hypothetical protein